MNLTARLKFFSTSMLVVATALFAGSVLADDVSPSTGGNNPSSKALTGSLDFQTKCQVLVDAMAKHDQSIINQAAAAMAGSAGMNDADHIADKFTEEDAQSFFQTSFNNCLAHPGATMASQAEAAFDLLRERINSRN